MTTPTPRPPFKSRREIHHGQAPTSRRTPETDSSRPEATSSRPEAQDSSREARDSRSQGPSSAAPTWHSRSQTASSRYQRGASRAETPPSRRTPPPSRRETLSSRREGASSRADVPSSSQAAAPRARTASSARTTPASRREMEPSRSQAAASRASSVSSPRNRVSSSSSPTPSQPKTPAARREAPPSRREFASSRREAASSRSKAAPSRSTATPRPSESTAARAKKTSSLPAETTGMRSRRFEYERRRARKRRRNRRIRSFFIILLVLVLLGGAGWFALKQLDLTGQQSSAYTDDYPGPGTGQVEVTIDIGATGTSIGETLVEAGVVKSTEAFNRAFAANKAAPSIRPGTYRLKKQMSASDAIAALLDEKNRSENTVTVTPGQTTWQIVERITSVTSFTADEVNAALKDTTAIGLPEEAGGNVEGWLAPGSYEVSSSDTPTTLLSQMIKRTIGELDALGVPKDQRELILNKASILEREVNIDEYLPKVARVIENRLNNPDAETMGYLQMDSSVLYGVGKTGGVPSADDMADDNPYNTYLHKGLPPTPIAQPSEAAIKAVLKPADGPWLYYVTVNLETGETLFAQTLAEQEANTARFREYCTANPGKC